MSDRRAGTRLRCALTAIGLIPLALRSQDPATRRAVTPDSSKVTSNTGATAVSGQETRPEVPHAGSGPPGSADATETPADFVAAGDREQAAMRTPEALADYNRAVALDSSNYEALYKAARCAVDLGEFESDAATRQRDFDSGLQLARRAVSVNPGAPDGHFHVARALGREALSVGGKKRIQYAKEVRVEALAALASDPNHPGALHVMGVWNAEVMRLSGIERFIARNLLGGGVLGTASWRDAVQYMEQAVAVDPMRIVHHLDLGKIYADIGDKAKAREQFQTVLATPAAEYNDPHYKQDAARQLARL